MISTSMDGVASEFSQRFDLKDGDYIEFERNTSVGVKMTVGRIVSVVDCYYNQRGGYTANVKVAPLLVSGRLGNTMEIALCINANGSGLRGVFGRVKRC